ncbi:MAG: putative acetyl/propionyl carboxylase alpha subunit AccA2 [Candidatus Binatia bacterium]|nr:MAG: putative acetyl/propionyl carboxylase alpha subunit AccA2 [Candidatus Binatia bacterium]
MGRFHKVLVANRGEIARRIFRACRELGLRTVALYADPDREAPFVREADEAVALGAPVTGQGFLAIETIIAAAKRTGADAIHPGYGFLAENADFAQACADAGLVFVGPPPKAIRAMGTKIEAKQIAQRAGVPIIPGFSARGLGKAAILERARELGLPLLVKASAGGGGKGMRLVERMEDLEGALEGAAREAESAFGDATLLVERYVERPRHIEIQVLADEHGNVVHLFERECSIQRRYQKIFEEAPSPFVNDLLRERMGAAAVALAKAIGYVNAGTVEFVVDPHGAFYFLEMNTRLQVEHPVTEEITGLDLVRLQLEIAQGEPIPFAQEDLVIRGHAIEARLYAEDPWQDFLPSTGTIVCWEPAPVPGVRYESGVEQGSAVTIYYDPMLAKIIAWGSNRNEAVRRLSRALEQLRVHGVACNREFLLRVLSHDEFRAANFDTHFIAQHPELLAPPDYLTAGHLHAIAAALWEQQRRRQHTSVLASIPSGWRNNPTQRQWVEYKCRDAVIRVEYRLGKGSEFEALAGNSLHQGHLLAVDDRGIALEIDGLRRRYAVTAAGTLRYVDSVLGSSVLEELPRFPLPEMETVRGGCTAPMPGRIVAVRVSPGEEVERGQVLAVLEAMKMEHEVAAPHAGTVREVLVEPGQQVEAGAVLVVIEPRDSAAGMH